MVKSFVNATPFLIEFDWPRLLRRNGQNFRKFGNRTKIYQQLIELVKKQFASIADWNYTEGIVPLKPHFHFKLCFDNYRELHCT